MSSVVRQPDHEQIDRDVACVSCGYNLRTLAPSSVCPECGQRVTHTLYRGLHHADPAWLKTVKTGAFVLVGTWVWLALGTSFSYVLGRFSGDAALSGALITWVGGMLWAITGSFLLTRQEPGTQRTRALSVGTGVRVAPMIVIVQLLAMAVSAVLGGVLTSLLWPILSLLTVLAWVLLLGVHARRLLVRADKRGVRAFGTFVVWLKGGIGVLTAVAVLAAIASEWLPASGTLDGALHAVAGFLLPGLPLVGLLHWVLLIALHECLEEALEKAHSPRPESVGAVARPGVS